MNPRKVPRWCLGMLFVIAVTVGCSDRGVMVEQAPAIRATVEPIYDENGQPQSSYYSSNSQMTWTTDSTFEPAGASYTRNYFEEYTWVPSYQTWDNLNSYGNGDLPFGTGVPPEINVASARMAFGGSSAPEIRTSSGALLQPSSTRPPLQSDTISMAPITLPSGGPGSPTASAPNAGAKDLRAFMGATVDGLSRRGAAVERLVANAQTKARVLAQLRSTFSESLGTGGLLQFTKRLGTTEVTAIFNPAVGAVTEMTTSEDTHILSRTTYRYQVAPDVGGFVLEEVNTQLFGPTGAPGRSFKQNYRDITVR